MAPMRLGCAQSCWEVKVTLALMDCENGAQAEELLYLQEKLGHFMTFPQKVPRYCVTTSCHGLACRWCRLIWIKLGWCPACCRAEQVHNVLPCLTKSEPGVHFLRLEGQRAQ